MPDDGKSPAQKARDRRAKDELFWKPRWAEMQECRDFLLGDRFQLDNGAHNRDRRLTQIRGEETDDTIRHVIAKLTEKPRNAQARGIGEDEDAQVAEVVLQLVENRLNDPWLGFQTLFEAALMSALVSRIGFVWMDMIQDGRDGMPEPMFSWQPDASIMWDPCYWESPHHPLCPHLHRRRRLQVDEAREMYGAPWLEPDRGQFDIAGNARTGVPLLRGRRQKADRRYEDDRVTLDECWYKRDYSTKRGPLRQNELPASDRYMVCAGGCGYRSDTQGDLGMQLPEDMQRACPTCSGDLARIDALDQQDTVKAYARGRRLVIVAPYCQAPNTDDAVYDGNWPVKRARTFPVLVLTPGIEPGDPTPRSYVDRMWDQQCASDNMSTMALQRTFSHQTYFVMDKVGFYDAHGRRFEMRDDQFNLIFRDATKFTAKLGGYRPIERLPGTGLDPMFPVVNGMIQDKLTSYRGVTDLGPIDESRKQQSGVAIAQLNQIGNVQIAWLKRRVNFELSKWYGVVSDYELEALTPQRAARLNVEGINLVIDGMSGADFPNYDWVIEDTPDFTGLEKARADAFDGLMQTYTQAVQLGLDPVVVVKTYGKVNNLPPTIIQEWQDMLEQMPPRPPGPPVPPGAPPQGPAPGAQALPMDQPQDTGAVPAL